MNWRRLAEGMNAEFRKICLLCQNLENNINDALYMRKLGLIPSTWIMKEINKWNEIFNLVLALTKKYAKSAAEEKIEKKFLDVRLPIWEAMKDFHEASKERKLEALDYYLFKVHEFLFTYVKTILEGVKEYLNSITGETFSKQASFVFGATRLPPGWEEEKGAKK